MPNLPPLPTLHELLRLLNLKACGQLSQNFLLQPWSIKGLVNSAGDLNNANILEVGPGPGGITRCILEKQPHHLAVVELDRRFLIGLEQLRDAANFMKIKMDVYNQDILKFNYDNVFPQLHSEVHPEQAWNDVETDDTSVNRRKTHIIGNLPFSISTPLLSQWLHDISEHRGLWTYGKVPLTITFQEELAHRMVAGISDRERSRYSVLCQSLCEVKVKRILPGSTFLPKAKVNCAVVHMVPRSVPLIKVPYPYLSKVVKAVFQFKNKHIVNGIESLFPPEHCELVIRMFSASGVSPDKTSIEVTIDEFGSLAREYHRICTEMHDFLDYDFQSNKNDILYNERKKMQRIVLDGGVINAAFVKERITANCENKLV